MALDPNINTREFQKFRDAGPGLTKVAVISEGGYVSIVEQGTGDFNITVEDTITSGVDKTIFSGVVAADCELQTARISSETSGAFSIIVNNILVGWAVLTPASLYTEMNFKRPINVLSGQSIVLKYSARTNSPAAMIKVFVDGFTI